MSVMSDAVPSPKTSGLAIASLVTALTCISPAAIICGHMALSQIKKSAGTMGGYGIALAGTIIGYVSLVVGLFSIIPMLFIGARAWKEGSDRAACIITQRNLQQAVRSYQNTENLSPGDALDIQKVMTSAGTISITCPAGGTLTISETIPAVGEAMSECSIPNHNPADITGW